MKIIQGDVWEIARKCRQQGYICYVTIPTNEGYTKQGKNVMGRGLAKQASIKYINLSQEYGEWLRQGHKGLYFDHSNYLICFPVKLLLPDTPWLSWKQKASLELIKENLLRLQQWQQCKCRSCMILVVPFGCGNGGLSEKDVVPMMKIYLENEAFILVLLP